MKTVLIAEDDPAVRQGLQANLEREKLKVLVERDGRAALARARRENLDLLILDVMLPSMSGFDICARLKKEGYATPIFMLTGLADEGSKMRGLGLGADDYIPKPFSIQELLLRIRNAIERTERTLGSARALDQEFRKAREIQQGSLPKIPPRIDTLDVWGTMVPATHVGGDYFDYLLLGPRKLAVIVADVSGKGLPAALYVQKMQGIVQASKTMIRTAGDILLQLQEHLGTTMEPSSFITAVTAMFDLDRHTVEFASAGHLPVFRRRASKIEEIKPDGMWIGQTIGRNFDEELRRTTVEYGPGDVFVLYSDGVVECMNEHSHEFGFDRFRRLLRGKMGTSKALIQQAMRSLQRFAGGTPQSDDITIVVVQAQ